MQFFSLKQLTVKNFTNRPTMFRKVQMIVVSLVLSMLVAFFVIVSGDKLEEKSSPKNVLMKALQSSMKFCLVTVTLTSILQSYSSTLKIKKLFINAKEIAETSSSKFNIAFDFSHLKKAAWTRLAVMFLFYLTLHVIVMKIEAQQGRIEVFVGLLATVLILTINIIVYKFVFFVYFINCQLKFLEKLLENIFAYQPVKIIDNINLHLLNVKPLKPDENSYSKILFAREVYNKIYENGKIIDESAGLTVLSLLISLVIRLTTAGYEVYKMLLGGAPKTRMPGEIKINLSIQC